MKIACAVLALSLATTLPLAAQAADAKFTLSSPAVSYGGFIPDKYANKNPQGMCSGDNVSLPLAWRDAPGATKSFAVTMFDPMPRAGLGFVHWVLYDIPPDRTALKEGEANSPAAFVAGKNGTGRTGWFGPCPPPEDSPHPYIVTLVATDIAPGTLPPGMTRDQLIAALQTHVLSDTTLVARYGKP